MSNIKLPKYSADDKLSADTLNVPINAILQCLNNLSNILNRSAIIQYSAVLLDSVAEGDLVYYNALLGKFLKALATLADNAGEQGQSVLAESCRVLGLVLAVNPATILRQGYYKSDIIKNTIGKAAAAGLYYLSPLFPGKATKSPGWSMRQPCISYYGDGEFSVMTTYLAHDNHHHLCYKKTLDTDLPAGATLVIDSSLFKLSSLSAIFIEGKLTNCLINFTANTITLPNSVSVGSLIVIFDHVPFAYGDSVVRTITSTDGTINITDRLGSFDVSLNNIWKDEGTVINPFAVSSILGNKLIKTPVVNKLAAGPGISVSKDSLSGAHIVSLQESSSGYRVTATDITCLGAQWSVDNVLSYLTFIGLATQDTSAVLTIPIINAGQCLYSCTFWGLGKGTGTLNYEYTLIPFSALASLPVLSDKAQLMSFASDTLNYKLVDTTIEIEANFLGILIIRLSGYDSAIYRCGCILKIKQALTEDYTLLTLSQVILLSLTTAKNVALYVVLKYVTYNAEE